MESLVNYQSGDDSDVEEDSSNTKPNPNGDGRSANLDSEWEAFANSIKADEVPKNEVPIGVPPPSNLKASASESEDYSSDSEDHEDRSVTASSNNGSSDDEEGSSGEEEDESGSSRDSSEESDDAEDAEQVSEHEQQSPSRKRRSPESDMLVSNRFKSRSPVDKKVKLSDHEGQTDKKEHVKDHSSPHHSGRDRRESSEKSRKSEEKHGSSRSGERRSSSTHKEKPDRRHRSRSRDRHRHSRGPRRSRERKHSRRSRSREKKHSGHDHKHREESRRSGSGRRRGGKRRDSERTKRRERRQSRSKERDATEHRRRRREGHGHRRRSRSISPVVTKRKNPREKMKEQLLQAQAQSGGSIEALKKHLAAGGQITDPRVLLMGANFNNAVSSTGEKITPQEAIRQQMEAMQQKAQELTGVAVPKYYNPAAVNPLKYAEQVQKRKLLWSKNKEKTEDPGHVKQTALWQATSFGQEKQDEKFRKLMGVKEDPNAAGGSAQDPMRAQMTSDQIRKQQELFDKLDKEYMMARMTTHTHRGMGLGVLSFNAPTTTASTQPPTTQG